MYRHCKGHLQRFSFPWLRKTSGNLLCIISCDIRPQLLWERKVIRKQWSKQLGGRRTSRLHRNILITKQTSSYTSLPVTYSFDKFVEPLLLELDSTLMWSSVMQTMATLMFTLNEYKFMQPKKPITTSESRLEHQHHSWIIY